MPSEPPSVTLLKLITGFWVSKAIYAAVKLGIPDALRHGPLHAADVATAVGANASATYPTAESSGQFRHLSRTVRRTIPIDGVRRAIAPLTGTRACHGPDSRRRAVSSVGGHRLQHRNRRSRVQSGIRRRVVLISRVAPGGSR